MTKDAIDEQSETEKEFPGQWVRIMCDCSCWGVWNRDGLPSEPEFLPIPDELRQRIAAWQHSYDMADDDYGMPDLPDGFSAEGLAIARAVKAELPGWTVMYLDEDKAKAAIFGKTPRTEYEYEIEPKD